MIDDMNAFDRQLASVVLRRVGPTRPVDDAAIITAITATQSPKWRFGSMFSATKFAAAGAVLALFGGLLLIAQPFDQQGSSVPGAATDAAADGESGGASVVTGHLEARYWMKGPPAADENLAAPGDGMEYRVRDVAVAPGRIEMGDARLSGDIAFTLNIDGWSGGSSGTPALEWGTVLIENDRGTWEGTYSLTHVHLDVESDEGTIVSDVGPVVMRLVGTGDYGGLSAILYGSVRTDADPNFGESVQGLVFPGNLPPNREVAAGTG